MQDCKTTFGEVTCPSKLHKILAIVRNVGIDVLALDGIFAFAESDKYKWAIFIAVLLSLLARILAIWDEKALKDSKVSVPVLEMSVIAMSLSMWAYYLYRLYGNYRTSHQMQALIVGILVAAVVLIPNVKLIDKKEDETQRYLEYGKYFGFIPHTIAIVCLAYSLTGTLTVVEICAVVGVLLILVPQLINNILVYRSCLRMRTRPDSRA